MTKTEKKELFEEAATLMVALLPPKEYGENAECERLYDIISELAGQTKHFTAED